MTVSRRRVAAWLRRIELVLVLGGIAALSWVGVVHVHAWRDQERWAQQLEQQLASREPVGGAAPAVPSRGTHGGADATPPRDPARARRTGPAVADPTLIGRIEVPRLQLSAIAREGTDPATLRRAVGHIANTALPGQRGNAGFAGHRDTFFRKLRHVRTGDEVIVTTPEGHHRYVVRETRIVQPTDVSVLDPTDAAVLTLVTCYPFSYVGAAPERFIVRAELVASRSPAHTTPGQH